MSRKRTVETIKTGRGTVMTFECVYPDKNPEGALDAIVRTMAYVGLFDGLEEFFPELKKAQEEGGHDGMHA